LPTPVLLGSFLLFFGEDVRSFYLMSSSHLQYFDSFMLNPVNNVTCHFLLQVANPITKYPWCANIVSVFFNGCHYYSWKWSSLKMEQRKCVSV